MNLNELSVLVFEPNPIVLEGIKLVLDSKGIKYDAAESKEEALKYFQQKSYHLVISGTQKGGNYTGPDMIREARKLGQRPVVVGLTMMDKAHNSWRGESYAHYVLFGEELSERLPEILGIRFGITNLGY